MMAERPGNLSGWRGEARLAGGRLAGEMTLARSRGEENEADND